MSDADALLAAGVAIVEAIEASDEACLARSVIVEAIRRGDTSVAASYALTAADATLLADPSLAALISRLELARYVVSQAFALAGVTEKAELTLLLRPQN